MIFFISHAEIEGVRYCNGELSLENGHLFMDLPDDDPNAPVPIPVEQLDRKAAKQLAKELRAEQRRQELNPGQTHRLEFTVKDVLQVSCIRSFLHPCRAMRIDTRNHGTLKFSFESRKEEKEALCLVQILVSDGGLLPANSENEAVRIWIRPRKKK